MTDRILRELERGLSDDLTVLPQYIQYFLRSYNQTPPYRFPDVFYRCLAHNKLLHDFPSQLQCDGRLLSDNGYAGETSNTPCHIVPEMGRVIRWINDAQDPNNLFAIKKRDFPDPVAPEILYEAFASAKSDTPVSVVFQDELHDYFGRYLWNIITLIAELRIPDPQPAYPVEGLPLGKVAELTHLRRDLIEGNSAYYRVISRNLSACLENFSPHTILTANLLGDRADGGQFVVNTRFAITFDPHTRGNEHHWFMHQEPILAKYSLLG